VAQDQSFKTFNPAYAEAHNNLGVAFGRKGRTNEAISQYQEAVRLKPDYADAQTNLAQAMELKRKSKPTP
jgi:Flp pilus assembly protein TadD